MNKEIFSIKPYKSIYFNAMLAKKFCFQLGDELEFRFTSDSAYFRINNNQIKGVKVHQASTSGFTIDNRIVHKRLSKLFMYDVNVIEDDGWFKIIEQ